MNNQLSWGKPIFELNGKPIELNEAKSLTLSDTELSDADIELTKYGAKHYSLTFKLSMTGDNPFATWYRRQCQIGREQKKALLYAVTHSHKVVIPFRVDDGEERYIVPLTPKMIRSIFRGVSWLPHVLILDKQYCLCYIKHGRLVRKKVVWPCAQAVIDKYEEAIKEKGI